jgi:hypothetical protein
LVQEHQLVYLSHDRLVLLVALALHLLVTLRVRSHVVLQLHRQRCVLLLFRLLFVHWFLRELSCFLLL